MSVRRDRWYTRGIRHAGGALCGFALTASLVVSCTKEYNPFADTSNARALVTSSDFDGADTLTIFSTHTLTVGAAVSELIDSFAVEVPGNRFWTDTTVRSPSTGADEYRFEVSFYDTGLQTIRITTYRRGGDVSGTEMRLFAGSPLHQDTLVRPLGAVCSLSTPPVRDRDVLYHWQLGRVLGRPQVFSATLPSIRVAPKPYDGHTGEVEHQQGYLWVSDSAMEHFSPPAPFSFGFYDNAGPLIICLNDSLRGDTVITGDSVLVFRIRLDDPTGIGRSPEIDGAAFESRREYINTYSHIFRRMERYSPASPRSVVVQAWDRNGVSSIDTFHLAFLAEGPRSEGASITLLNPREPLTVTSQQTFSLATHIDNRTGGTVVARAVLNGSLLPYVHAFSTGEDTASWPLTLLPDTNLVTVTVNDSGGVRQAAVTITIVSVPQVSDTLAPFVWRVMLDGTIAPADEPITVRDSTATAKVIVFDEGTGVATVEINGVEALPDNDGRTWYLAGVSLRHPYDIVTVAVADTAGNRAEQTISVIRNALPRLESGWEWPTRFLAGMTYVDTVRVWDDDFDQPRCELVGDRPAAMTLAPIGLNRWLVQWKPSITDTGEAGVLVRLSDSYEDTLILWKFRTDGLDVDAVRLMTGERDFPPYVEVDSELSVPLVVAPGTGLPPFTYFVRMTGPLGRVLHDSNIDHLRWTPRDSDTGWVQLIASVRDAQGEADTIYPGFMVVPANSHPCKLSYSFTGTRIGNVIDMRRAQAPDTLHFTINDLDHPLTERYTVSILRGGIRTLLTLDTTDRFDLVLHPNSASGRDTIRIEAKDRTGSTDIVVLHVLFGLASAQQVPDLSLWLDAEAGVTLVGGEVSVWEDRTSATLQLHSETVENRPGYLPDALNGYPVLTFNGDDDNLHNRSQTGDDWAHGPFTLFFVARLDEVTAGRRYTLLSSGGDHTVDLGVTCSGKMGIFEEESSNGCFSDSRTQSSNLEVAADTWHIFTYRSAQGVSAGALTADLRLSGRAASSPLSIGQTWASNDMILGAGEMGKWSGAWEGAIAQFIWYDRALSDTEVEAVETMLATKYALPLP